jgi:hypothetical protein
MVCNVEKEMIKRGKVIKQMLNRKYNFPLNKVGVVLGRISYTCILPSRAREALCSCSFAPWKKPTPSGSHELFCLLPYSVTYSISFLKYIDFRVKIQSIS